MFRSVNDLLDAATRILSTEDNSGMVAVRIKALEDRDPNSEGDGIHIRIKGGVDVRFVDGGRTASFNIITSDGDGTPTSVSVTWSPPGRPPLS